MHGVFGEEEYYEVLFLVRRSMRMSMLFGEDALHTI
jgi:hypothetical protein